MHGGLGSIIFPICLSNMMQGIKPGQEFRAVTGMQQLVMYVVAAVPHSQPCSYRNCLLLKEESLPHL